MSARLFETLESRQLLSASPTMSPLTSPVQLDHDQIQADLLKFRSDALSGFVTFETDVMAIEKDGVANAKTVLPLINTFFTDVKKMRNALKADNLTESKAVNADESTIAKDMRMISHDKHNAAAEKTDHAKLLADRIELQEDMISGLDARISTRQKFFSTLSGDMNAIITAAQSDPNASAQLVTDLKKAQTDKTNTLKTLTSDLQAVASARAKLVADLTAMQTAAG